MLLVWRSQRLPCTRYSTNKKLKKRKKGIIATEVRPVRPTVRFCTLTETMISYSAANDAKETNTSKHLYKC